MIAALTADVRMKEKKKIQCKSVKFLHTVVADLWRAAAPSRVIHQGLRLGSLSEPRFIHFVSKNAPGRPEMALVFGSCPTITLNPATDTVEEERRTPGVISLPQVFLSILKYS